MASPRPRPQVMRLTDAAATRIKSILDKAERPIAGVRVGVKNGGCAASAYSIV
jgi:iron-sulfur cluster assembly protein